MNTLAELSDRQEIHDLVLRYCAAVDRADYPGVRDVYAHDGVDHHTGFSGTADDYVAWLRERTSVFAGTMHLIGNHRVELFGDHAFAETYGTAVHWGAPADDETRNFTSGFRYLDHVRRDPDGWRIVERTAVREWTRSDAGRMREPEGEGPRGRRGPEDPSLAVRRSVADTALFESRKGLHIGEESSRSRDSNVEQRLRALEDRLEIIDLEATYARAFDERDGETWSGLFTEDGVYQSRPVGDAAPLTFVQGRVALRAFCADASFAGIHFLHLPQLVVDGDRATSRIHLEFHGDYAEDTGAPRLAMRGFYDVIYHRVDGRWLIAHRITSAFAREQSTVLGYPTGSALPES
ncbi:nuclear transport factor 2 family protein [Microbacterium paraoxydans]|uniref:nuclear transport factor 2 family protein n=1 Tax=Microbacterium paraoxydans TaxID=199592 RepID=UPI001CF9C949|nr:nuclear transport factor 2 family protein [Microbacterium paraoxydans]